MEKTQLETVIKIKGKVVNRSDETINKDIETGEIEVAIDKAVPLFNHGQHQACAAVYEVTAHALMTMPKGSVSDKEREMLGRAMKMVNQSKCMTTRSWTLRKTFDAMLASK